MGITIREGSSLYYSLLWTDADARARLLDRLSLINDLGTTLEDVHEPQVAERKIHWWHEELQRMVEGQARHPATQACQSSLAGDGTAALQACLDVLSPASTLRFQPPASDADADALLEQAYRARLALLSHALSEDAADLAVQSHPALAARAFGKHEQLFRLPQLIHRGHAVFSDAIYRQHGIHPSDLAARVRVATPIRDTPDTTNTGNSDATNTGNTGTTNTGNTGEPTDTDYHRMLNDGRSADAGMTRTATNASSLAAIPVMVDKPGRQTLLSAAVDNAHAELHRALADAGVIERYRQAPLLPLWRLLVLREKQVALWQRTQPDLLRERTTLTPLKKLYWAWRNKR